MPVDSNGSMLQVTTNYGGKMYDNEDPALREQIYAQNQQREQRDPLLKPLSKIQPNKPSAVKKVNQPKKAAKPPRLTKEMLECKSKADDALDKANSKDLRQRNIKS